ncbi:MAG: magnesium transporter [Candidatus Promineifilaceae bacterium]|nr:magnesium transporter [Candidatus Promineifilaceae bacterium]
MTELPPALPLEDEVLQLIREGRLAELRASLADYHPADIADLLDEMPAEEAVVLFNLLNLEVASEVLDETGSLVRAELVEKVDDEKLADLLDELPMDDAVEFLEDLPDPTAERLLGLMEPEEADDVRVLLAYEEETAGRLMNTDVITLRRNWSIRDALAFLAKVEEPETLHYLYVVDREQRLIGVVPIRNFILALSNPERSVESIMTPEVVAVPVSADQEELAEFISRYDFVAIPVVDERGRLVGVVTVDDALDVLAEEATEDIQRLGGSQPLASPYFSVSVSEVVRKRIIWLMFLFVASLLSSTVISTFEGMLGEVLVLMSFVPLITGTGGNAGSQTVTTIIRAIAVEEVRQNDVGRAWRREAAVGIVLGLLLGLVGAVVGLLTATFKGQTALVGAVIGLTLPLVVVWANTVATLVPIIAERLDIDPTVISAPMITTIVDATALLIYFLIARSVLGL